MKPNLTIKKLWGHSQNAVKMGDLEGFQLFFCNFAA
jgi:hypothetical protein